MAGALECKSAVIGGPSSSDLAVMQLEWRKFLPGGKVAFDPKYRFDLKEQISAVSLPLYFFAKPKEGLAGGARVDWRSDRDGVAVVIFVGAVLKVLD
mgnify:CR=1 FL=1